MLTIYLFCNELRIVIKEGISVMEEVFLIERGLCKTYNRERSEISFKLRPGDAHCRLSAYCPHHQRSRCQAAGGYVHRKLRSKRSNSVWLAVAGTAVYLRCAAHVSRPNRCLQQRGTAHGFHCGGAAQWTGLRLPGCPPASAYGFACASRERHSSWRHFRRVKRGQFLRRHGRGQRAS